MTWRYINPGYSQLIQRKDYPSSLSDIVDSSISKTGVAYKNTQDTGNYYQFSSLPENGEYWVKVDFYWTSNVSTNVYIREGSSKVGLNISCTYSGNASIYYCVNSATIAVVSSAGQALTGLKMGAINTVWVHVKWGVTGVGLIEFQINNKKFDKIQTREFPAPTGSFYYNTYGGNGFSSVIISDEEISPYEELVRLPVSSTTTDMSARDGGGYIASDTTQTLLQAVDTSTLIENYGSDANVTGIALVGNPAYEVDEVLPKMISLTKTGGVISEHQTIQLSASSESAIVSSFSTDMTITDLAAMQFGWKASE